MNTTLTVQAVIDLIRTEMSDEILPDTVDTAKTGDTQQPVTGIVTTFLATYAVIEQAAKLVANLIIAREPVFYNHRDETEWLGDDPIYLAKRRLIDEHNIVVFRLHDYIHARAEDGIIAGELQQLGWEAYADPETNFLCSIPAMSLTDLVKT